MHGKKSQTITLGERMKRFYENSASGQLLKKTPVIIRIDGRAFHTFTKKHCQSKFDPSFALSMYLTAYELLEKIQGAKIAYTQSDEISILLSDYDAPETSAWFDYNIPKLCSVSASMATVTFIKSFYLYSTTHQLSGGMRIIDNNTVFDARCFNLPPDEVMNYFVWRQQDCIRNSIENYARTLYPHNQLHSKSLPMKLAMIKDAGFNWETDLKEEYRYGQFIYKQPISEKNLS